jgi:MYXO-CTERM domain-containing protein
MRSSTRLRSADLVAALLALPLAACGGSVQPEPGVSPKDAPKLLAPAICFQAYRCCTMTALMGNANAGTSMDTCEMKTETALTNEVSAIEASERKGRVNYDGLKVQACLDYLKAPDTTCDALDMTFHLSGVPACANFLEPKVAVGDACTNDFECVDGFCDATGAAAGAEGKCRALGKTGESCADMGRCEPDLDCDATSMICVARAAPPPGQPAAAMCFYSSACSVGGGAPGAGAVLGIVALAAAVAARRRPRRARPLEPQ